MKLKLKEYFCCNNDIEQDVRNNSNFEPPKGRNKKLDDYIDMTKVIPRNDDKKKKSFNMVQNHVHLTWCKTLTPIKGDLDFDLQPHPGHTP